MITAQDIHEKTFEKAKIGGYDMAAVDDFLEELADEIGAAQKENAVLKSKMKVLVDKIEEYRTNEEALNTVLLSAQKLAVQIETEARQRAATMIADADRQVKARVGSIERETEIQEARLAEAKKATSSFLAEAKKLFKGQIKRLDDIGNGLADPAAAPAASAPSVDEAVRSIESSVSRAQPEPALTLDLKGAARADQPKGFDNTQPFSL